MVDYIKRNLEIDNSGANEVLTKSLLKLIEEDLKITDAQEFYCKEDGTHNSVLNLPGLSAETMVEFCNYARKKYYLRPWYILHRLKVGLTNINDLKRSLKAFGRLKQFLFKR
jgi:hypothetical protein